MIEDFPTPSRLLRTVAHLARWVLWLLASVWITLLLVWGALHFLIVPRISELRPWLEEQATQALGIRLRLGDVVARSNGLIPSVELKDVQLFDEQGRLALRLPSVQAAFSPRSVFGGGFEQLYIDSPVLEVRRSADGRLWVAGLALTRGPDTDSPAVDWLFSQFELAIRHGTVTWTDELRAAPPLTLTDLDWVLRNRHHTHAMRLDATPPQGWGERLSFSGIFKQPLLSQRAGQWRDWKGQLYANLVQIDLAQLHLYHSDTHVDMARGSGSLRAWIEIDHAEPTAATLDLAVKNVNLRFDHQREALDFAWVAGRLGAKKVPGGVEFFTQALEFDTADGLHWPGGNVRLGLFSGDANHAAHGDLLADRLDLAALGQIVSRLPLDDALKAQVEELAPRGLVQSLQASWTGAPHQPSDFSARGRLEQLAIAPARAAHGRRPGFNGVDLDFDLNRQGGHATVALRDGAVLAPGIFDDPVIALEQLAGEVQWKHDAGRWNLQLSNVRLANADAQGTLQLKWQSDSVASAPGLLDLQGSLSRAQLNRVYRYLPQGIDKKVRDYVRDAVQGGSGSAVSFNVKGNLRDFPFLDPRQGEFRIAASLHEASYAYAPASVLGSGSLPWPALTQFSSDFLIDKGNLHIMGGHGGIAGSGALQVSKVDGLVSNLY
ncbi:MAG: YhdP family phospholipid transporter, partial [Rhodoferax sp.]